MYTTAFVRHEEDEAAIAENVTENTPGYTAYGEWCAVCDKFNKNFCNRTWSHITGGRNYKGEEGNIHNYALSNILQNIFNVYHDINGEDHLQTSFEYFCCNLADDDIARYVFEDAK